MFRRYGVVDWEMFDLLCGVAELLHKICYGMKV
jgi:hypothetical protein